MTRSVRIFTTALTLVAACKGKPAEKPAAPDTTVAAAPPSMPQQIADVMVQLQGGKPIEGLRFTHTKGMVVTGTFTPAKSATSISRAAHFKTQVPVTVRFSNTTGIPDIPDADPRGAPRGMAIRFALPNGSFTDIVANSHNGFFVGTAEDFLAFLKAVAATKPDSPHPSPIEAFLGAHPRALKVITDYKDPPTSWATLGFFSNNALTFVDSAGVQRKGRYQIIPVAGLHNLSAAEAAKVTPNYLFDELTPRLKRGPIEYRVYVQLADSTDQTSDGSIVWPDDRKRVELGKLSLTAVAPANDSLQRALKYSPLFLTDGIQLADDPFIALRAAVYALSAAHR